MKILEKYEKLSRNDKESSRMIYRSSHPDSTSLSDGNLVDGLPSARHSEAGRAPHGVFGPAAIGTVDQQMYEIEQFFYRKLHRGFVLVKVCI